MAAWIHQISNKARPARLLLWLAFGFLWYILISQVSVEWTVNPQYSYGWIVPFLCVYLFWERWKTRPAAVVAPGGGGTAPAAFPGFVPFVLLAFLVLPTRLLQEANPEWRLISWLLAIEVLGLTLLAVHCLGGRPGLAHFAFPIGYFAVAVPWPTVVESPLIQGLTRWDATATIEILNLCGVPAVQRGNLIEVSSGVVGIDEACSGIRSFQASLMISLFFGELYRLRLSRRVALVLIGLGLAFLFNVCRTFILVSVASRKGIPAISNWHDPAGITILLACFVVLWMLGRWLKSRTADAPVARAPAPDQGLVPSAALRPAIRPLYLLAPWLLFVEAGVEAWYRVHEARVPEPTTWTVKWPRDAASFHELPLSEPARRYLRFDEGSNAVWQQPDGSRWQMIFFRWNPGRVAVHLARGHTPEICLAATGKSVAVLPGVAEVQVQGLDLFFRSYVVREALGPVHVFYCLWEDRAVARSPETTRISYGNRLASVLEGRRNLGQRSLEVVVWGVRDAEQARAALQRELEKFLVVTARAPDG